jgi:hypothetical protein
MAFNKLQPASGPFYLGARQSMDILIWRGASDMQEGKDHGAQWIMADPVDEGFPVTLQVNNFCKMLRFKYATSETDVEPFSGPYINYRVTVTNVGFVDACHFTVQGGGNV